MTELLHSDMILAAILPRHSELALDPKSTVVYRCAERNMTVGETVTAAKQSHQEVEQTICELVVRKMITVRVPSVKPGSTGGPANDIDKFHEIAGCSDHYELLGVDQDTPRLELRTRYFELSKRFHPDKVFGSASKEQREKMSFVFQRLTAAYDVLSNPKKKAEYDASIAEVLELRAIEKKLKAAMDRTSSDPVSTSTSKDQQLSDPVPAPLPSDGPPCDETSTRITIDKFTPSNPPKEADNARRDEIRRKRAEQAVADLLRRRSDSPVPPPDNLLEKMLSEAESALSQERPADAQAMCKKILAACPEHVGAKEILKQVSEIQSKTQAQMHIRRGRYAVREGQVKEAKWHLEQAVAVDKSNVDARHLLAEIMLTNERDAFSALAMMKEVIVLGGQKARYFITLGDIFLEMKDLDRAADAYNKALRMEPENPELKKKIRLCKR